MRLTFYRITLAVFILLAGLMLPEATHMPLSSQYTIGPGFLPTIMLVAIMGFALILLIKDFISKPLDSDIAQGGPKRLLIYFLATVLFVLGMQFIGIVFSIVAFLFLLIYFQEKYSLWTAAKASLVTGIIIYLVFHTWLGIPITILNFL